jgi:hypothetical protein
VNDPTRTPSRRGALACLLGLAGGLAAMTLPASPAQAGKTTWRRYYAGYGHGGYYDRSFQRKLRNDTTFRRRFYGGYYAPAPSYYAPAPVVVPAPPAYYGPSPYYAPRGFQLRIGPVLQNRPAPGLDPLSLLEA